MTATKKSKLRPLSAMITELDYDKIAIIVESSQRSTSWQVESILNAALSIPAMKEDIKARAFLLLKTDPNHPAAVRVLKSYGWQPPAESTSIASPTPAVAPTPRMNPGSNSSQAPLRLALDEVSQTGKIPVSPEPASTRPGLDEYEPVMQPVFDLADLVPEEDAPRVRVVARAAGSPGSTVAPPPAAQEAPDIGDSSGARGLLG
jgi:hypothetical protein